MRDRAGAAGVRAFARMPCGLERIRDLAGGETSGEWLGGGEVADWPCMVAHQWHALTIDTI